MKKYISLLLVLIFAFSSFAIHKFYVSIYQINYAEKSKMLQITARIFEDDLNAVLQKKYNKKTHIGLINETEDDRVLLKKYFSENLSIKVNGQEKTIAFVSNEAESNVVICYFKITSISKLKSIEIKNTALLELNNEQQNIMQTTIYGKKKSLLLTNENVKGLLNM